MLHPNSCHCARAHVTGNAIAAHLKFMGNGRRRPGQFGTAQAWRGDAPPININEGFGLGHRDMTLPAGGLFRVGRYGRVSLQLFRPTAPGMTGKALNRCQIGFFHLMRDIRR